VAPVVTRLRAEGPGNRGLIPRGGRVFFFAIFSGVQTLSCHTEISHMVHGSKREDGNLPPHSNRR